jgi:hypothetical protein
VFHVVSNIFSLIFNEVLISLHSCLDSTYTNCATAMRGVFKFLYKETADPIIFIIGLPIKANKTVLGFLA